MRRSRVPIQQQSDVTELRTCSLQVRLHVLDQRCAWWGGQGVVWRGLEQMPPAPQQTLSHRTAACTSAHVAALNKPAPGARGPTPARPPESDL